MKKKMLDKCQKIAVSMLGIVAILPCCLVTVSAAETDSTIDYSSMTEYSSYAEVIGDTAANSARTVRLF